MYLRDYFGDDAPLDRRVQQVDGTHRTRTVAQTLASIGDKLGTLGISRVIDLTPLDRIGLPVFNFCIPNHGTESYTAGKGLTREACLVSGLMEAFELRCALASHPRYELRGLTRAQVGARGEAVDPNTLLLPVEGEFSPEHRHDWFRCLELGTRREAYLPADLFGFGYAAAPDVTRCTPYVNTNGVASGNSVHEATLHAVFELIERDALVLSNFSPPRAVEIDRDALSTTLAAVIARLDAADIELRVFDITSDLAIPAYQAYLVDACGFGQHHLHSGMGCHLDPHVALSRAITEACQVRLTYFAGSREDVADHPRGDESRAALCEFHRLAQRRPLPAPAPTQTDLGVVLDDVLRRLEGVGCPEVWVANLSRPDFEQVAVACYVPGLEGPYYDEDGRLAVGERAWQLRERHGARTPGF